MLMFTTVFSIIIIVDAALALYFNPGSHDSAMLIKIMMAVNNNIEYQEMANHLWGTDNSTYIHYNNYNHTDEYIITSY